MMRWSLQTLPAVADAAEALSAARLALSRERRPRAGAPHVLRVEVPLAAVDPLAWLMAHPFEAPLAFADRDGTLAVAGRGVALRIAAGAGEALSTLSALERSLQAAPPRLRLFGAMAFTDDDERDACWQGLGEGTWLLPRVEVGWDLQGAWLAVHVACAEGDDPARGVADALAALARLAKAAVAPANPAAAASSAALAAWPALRSRRDAPERAPYAAAVADALLEIESGAVDKVVLARRSELRFAAAIDPAAALARLASLEPSSFRFCIPGQGAAWIGASPERLLRVGEPGASGRPGRELVTEAMAGTRPRGADAGADALLCLALRGSGKDGREHALVVSGIAAALAELALGEVEVGAIDVHCCTAVQHLRTPIAARLRPGVQVAAVLAALHPTAAVAGWPRRPALALLRRLEPFDRGLYAAPVGWIGAAGAEFAVGLRGAVIRGSNVTLHAGAGLVAGSDAAEEWAEIEAKVEATLRALSATSKAPNAPGLSA